MKSDKEWKETLTPEQYRVLRTKGTEAPFTGEYWDKFEDGVYKCAGCGQELFRSEAKFDAGCGWPSFDAAAGEGKVRETTDSTHGAARTEILCSRCDGHLGHVFDDGPSETGLRYCVNSASVKLDPKKGDAK